MNGRIAEDRIEERICKVRIIDGVIANYYPQGELIRCKDCKWYELDKEHYCGFGGHGYRFETDYCSDAERKED